MKNEVHRDGWKQVSLWAERLYYKRGRAVIMNRSNSNRCGHSCTFDSNWPFLINHLTTHVYMCVIGFPREEFSRRLSSRKYIYIYIHKPIDVSVYRYLYINNNPLFRNYLLRVYFADTLSQSLSLSFSPLHS